MRKNLKELIDKNRIGNHESYSDGLKKLRKEIDNSGQCIIGGNSLNHKINNLEVLCSKCHIGGHKKEQYKKYKEVINHSDIRLQM